MKKLLLLTVVSLTRLNVGAEAMEKEELPKSSSKQITSTMDPTAPIITGFFGRILVDTTMEKEEKLQRASTHVTACKEKYELFIEQIGSTYFRKHFLQNVKDVATWVISFFEEKLERLEEKHTHFKFSIENSSQFTKEVFPVEPIGTYNRQYCDDLAAQVDHAHKKIKVWEIIFRFVDQFPLRKASTSPIIQRAIETEVKKLVNVLGTVEIIRPNDLGRIEKHRGFDSSIEGHYYSEIDIYRIRSTAKKDIDAVARKNPVQKLNDMIKNSYDLKHCSEAKLKKWEARIILGEMLLNLRSNQHKERLLYLCRKKRPVESNF